jgi:hypothetical protein
MSIYIYIQGQTGEHEGGRVGKLKLERMLGYFYTSCNIHHYPSAKIYKLPA